MRELLPERLRLLQLGLGEVHRGLEPVDELVRLLLLGLSKSAGARSVKIAENAFSQRKMQNSSQKNCPTVLQNLAEM